MNEVRLHSLDGLRGIASLTVVIGHSLGQAYTLELTNLSAGFRSALESYFRLHSFTVPVFMCLSGYVLGLQSVRHMMLRGGLIAYFGRRARRILPAYYFAIVFSLLFAFVLGDIKYSSLSDIIFNVVSPLLLLHDYWGSSNDYNVPLWSLPVEWHAYMLLPLFLFVWINFGGSLAAICMVATVGFFLVLAPWAYCHYYLIFFVGVGAAYLSTSDTAHIAQLRKSFPWGHAFFFALIVQVAILIRLSFDIFAGMHFVTEITWAIVSALLILALSNGLLPRTEGFLNSGVVQWLGQRSYSLYLLHWPMLMLAQKLAIEMGVHSFIALAALLLGIVIPSTFTVGSLSWAILERQSGRSKPRSIWLLWSHLHPLRRYRRNT